MARTKAKARQNMSGYSDKKIKTDDGQEVIVRRKHRKRPGTKARQEVRRYQSMGKYATMTMLPKEPFSRLVREVLQNLAGSDYRVSKSAMNACQQAAESYMTDIFRAADRQREHAKRNTLYTEDVKSAIECNKHLSEQI